MFLEYLLCALAMDINFQQTSRLLSNKFDDDPTKSDELCNNQKY